MRFEVNCKSHHRVMSYGLICQLYPVNKDVVHVLPKPILMQGLHHMEWKSVFISLMDRVVCTTPKTSFFTAVSRQKKKMLHINIVDSSL